jgi:hypothetical protein
LHQRLAADDDRYFVIFSPHGPAARPVLHIMLVAEVGQGFQKMSSPHAVAPDPDHPGFKGSEVGLQVK